MRAITPPWEVIVTPIFTVTLLFWVALGASIYCFARDVYLRAVLSDHRGKLALLLLLTLLWRVPTNGKYFHGLEYEDSYIYTVVGRQISEGAGPSPASVNPSYSVDVCEIGSLRSCQRWESFPEHLIGYPYVISIFSRVFGYTPSMGSIINLIASCITTLLVFLIALLITDDLNIASFAGFIFAVTPVFAVYGLETSAEPFSGLCIILVVWLYLRLCDSDGLELPDQIITWVAYSSALFLSQTVKREDILLTAIMPIMLPFMLRNKNLSRQGRNKIALMVITTSLLATILCAAIHLFQTSASEMELLRRFPMTPKHFVAFVGGFMRSFFVFKWYGGTVFAVGAGVIIACIQRRRALLPLTLLTAFILLYACHIRSYYQMESGHIEPQSALRFSMNFMALWAIMAGLGIGSILTSIANNRFWIQRRRALTWGLSATLLALSIISFVATIRLRNYEVEDEMIARLKPAFGAMHVVSQFDTSYDLIVTMEPLVVQMYARPETRIVDLESIDLDSLQTMIPSDAVYHLIFVKETNRLSEDDLNRYGQPLRYLLSLRSTVLRSGDNFQIVAVQ